jgi:hypothetical protein
MKMKKFITALVLLSTMAVQASNTQFLSFLNYNSALELGNKDFVSVLQTNGATGTTLFGPPGFFSPPTNITYFTYANEFPQIVSISSAIVAYATNMIGGLTNSIIGSTGGFTNVSGVGTNLYSYNPFGYQLTGTNMYLIQYTSGVSNSNAGNIVPGPFVPITINNGDANGQVNTNCVFVFGIAGDTASCTNSTNIFIFAKSYDGHVYDMANTNSVSITENGTNEVIGTYQPSSAWLAGVKSVAIYKYQFGTNFNSTNTFITKAGISMSVP